MKSVTICKNCGGKLASMANQKYAICLYCDSKFTLSQEEMYILPKRIIPLHFRYVDSIRDICASHYALITDDYLVMSGSLKKSMLFKRVQKDFHIPKADDAYLVYHDYAHLLTWRRVGLAFCTSGIYYRRSFRELPGKISWEEFKNSKISHRANTDLYIGHMHFGLCADAQKIYQVMCEIKKKI